MFERFIIQCILYDTSHKSLEHTTLNYIISGFKLSFLHTILFYIRRLLICNCTHSSILPALHPSYFRSFLSFFPHPIRSFLSYFPHPIRSSSSVKFYLRSDLTADYRTVLCLRSPLLFPFLLLYNLMFERFMQCILYDAMYPL